ncbi:DUF3106 domain-containing protein [Acidovorax cavernicola]|uniref:DUF3106 domain-containing protein n=1 Tax=Acidovorax cavernicola TaxID=1675792 RepID=A0A9X8D8I5_9BURK|nr:DUF3106 domain-containing protein [Acidovorax cavernicola]RIX84637.1 DUF3106 domain-containing protein [Acidovorax cavernicola]
MRRRSVFRAEALLPLRPLKAGVVVWASALATATFGLTLAGAQTLSETTKSVAPATTIHGAASPKAVATTKPLWSDLTAEQQLSLKPLAAHWNTLNIGQKRKWLALSRNYANMPADDQVTLHSRMIEWAALSNQQRAQARLNFAEVKRVPADERKLKWEQYQALSEEEKRKLAERAPPKPRGAALPVRPVSAQKLVPVPAVTPPGQHTPRIVPATLPTPVLPSAAVVVSSPATPPAPPERAPAAAGTAAAPAASAPGNLTPPPVPAEAQVPAPSAATAPAASSSAP